MTIELTVLISVVCTFGGFGLSYLAFKRNARKDACDEGKSDGVILTQLGYITSSLDDIKSEQKSLSTQYVEVIKKQAMMERDLKTVFGHLENLRADIKSYHHN